MNLIEYARIQKETFEEKEFNDVDNLIFSQLIMSSFELLKKSDFHISDLFSLEEYENYSKNIFMYEEQKIFYELLLKTKRYKDIKILDFVHIQDEVDATQFCAAVFEFSKNEYYLAFRGTDASISGWKEDFMMTFMDAVNAQQLASKYLDEMLNKHEGKFIVGGHSKGGNLAEYASIYSKYQNRIAKIYSNDGPGFKDNLFGTKEYLNIKDRIYRLVPSSSPIGILMHTDDTRTTYIESTGVGIYQHTMFTWILNKEGIKKILGCSFNSRLLNDFILKTLENTLEEEREHIVDALFSLLSEDTLNVFDLKTNWFKNAKSIVHAAIQSSKTEREKIFHTTKNLLLDFYQARKEISYKGNCINCNKKIDAYYKENKIYYKCPTCNKVYLEYDTEFEILYPKIFE